MTTTPQAGPPDRDRRRLLARLTMGGICLFLLVQLGLLVRFLLPRSGSGGPRLLRAGRPQDFPLGTVDQRFLKRHRTWIVRSHSGIYALFARCTHLGCTPAWDPGARKFRCPCHGSGFALDGTNLEGPAPIPLERFPVTIDADGYLVVDLGTRLHLDSRGRWSGPGAELPLQAG